MQRTCPKCRACICNKWRSTFPPGFPGYRWWQEQPFINVAGRQGQGKFISLTVNWGETCAGVALKPTNLMGVDEIVKQANNCFASARAAPKHNIFREHVSMVHSVFMTRLILRLEWLAFFFKYRPTVGVSLAVFCDSEWRPRRVSSDALSTGQIVLFLPWWNTALEPSYQNVPYCFSMMSIREDRKL